MYPPWYLDPCLGFPIPGRANSVRILHPLSIAQPRTGKTRPPRPGKFRPRKVRMRPFVTLYRTESSPYMLYGPWVQGEAR